MLMMRPVQRLPFETGAVSISNSFAAGLVLIYYSKTHGAPTDLVSVHSLMFDEALHRAHHLRDDDSFRFRVGLV